MHYNECLKDSKYLDVDKGVSKKRAKMPKNNNILSNVINAMRYTLYLEMGIMKVH